MFERARSGRWPLVLATVVATRGSTYRKAGAQMLIAPGGGYEGLLSGGCLESDLAGHAESVFATHVPKLVRYDNSGDADLLWGLGAGCEGGMDVWLIRLDAAAGWEPFGTLAACFERRSAATYGLVLESAVPGLAAGASIWSGHGPTRPTGLPPPVTAWLDQQLHYGRLAAESRIVEFDAPRVRMFVSPVALPRELLLAGGGPDALPLVEFAAALGWRVTVVDHRPAYAEGARFPRAERVVLTTPAALEQHVDLAAFDAAVIMSHHLATDFAALRTLATSGIPYVGLLGPASRRKRLLADLDAAATAMLGARLHAPVGLDLGGRDQASVALSIVAEIQAFFHGRSGLDAPRQGAPR